MTPDELLKDLRDIELPDAAVVASEADFSPLPFLVLASVLFVVLVVRAIRRRSWLRQARCTLRQINGEDPDNAAALIDLATKIAAYRQVTPLPTVAFLPHQAFGPREVKLLHEHLQKVLAQ